MVDGASRAGNVDGAEAVHRGPKDEVVACGTRVAQRTTVQDDVRRTGGGAAETLGSRTAIGIFQHAAVDSDAAGKRVGTGKHHTARAIDGHRRGACRASIRRDRRIDRERIARIVDEDKVSHRVGRRAACLDRSRSARDTDRQRS